MNSGGELACVLDCGKQHEQSFFFCSPEGFHVSVYIMLPLMVMRSRGVLTVMPSCLLIPDNMCVKSSLRAFPTRDTLVGARRAAGLPCDIQDIICYSAVLRTGVAMCSIKNESPI